MCITEYNEAETMQLFKQEGIEEGLQKGLQKGLEKGRLESILNLKLSMGISTQQAITAIGIPKNEQGKYLALADTVIQD